MKPAPCVAVICGWVLLALPVLAGAAAPACDPVPVPEAVAQFYQSLAGDSDQNRLDSLRLEDLDGDGFVDMLAVTRYQTEGGAGDGASVFYRMGNAQGICALSYDINLDAGPGPIRITASAPQNTQNPPDMTLDYAQNQTETGAAGITVSTRPHEARYHFDPAQFGYVEARP